MAFDHHPLFFFSPANRHEGSMRKDILFWKHCTTILHRLHTRAVREGFLHMRVHQDTIFRPRDFSSKYILHSKFSYSPGCVMNHSLIVGIYTWYEEKGCSDKFGSALAHKTD